MQADPQDTSSSSQLLLEIIQREESQDLRLSVDEVKRIVVGHLGANSVKWSVQDDAVVVDFVQDAEKELLFVGIEGGGGPTHFAFRPDELTAPATEWCYLVKTKKDIIITPENVGRVVLFGLIVVDDLHGPLHQMATDFHRLSTDTPVHCTEVRQLLTTQLLELHRWTTVERCLEEVVLARPLNVPKPSRQDANYEEHICRSEKIVLDWIAVLIYHLEMKGRSSEASSLALVMESEISYWEKRYDVLSELHRQLGQTEYQQVVSELKAANSVLGDEVESLLVLLQSDLEKARTTTRMLRQLRGPLERIKYSSLLELYQLYQEIVDRVIVVTKHAGGYDGDRQRAASQLLFLIGNQIVDKCSVNARQVLDKLLKGQPRQAIQVVEATRRALRRCIDTYDNINKWQRLKCRLVLNIDRTLLLSNFQSLEIRLEHMLDVCQTTEQFGHFVDDVQQPLPTFTSERDRDLGQVLRHVQDYVVQRTVALVNEQRNCIFAIHSHEWHDIYAEFQREVRNEEIRLVNAMEQAVDECPTLWKIHDILTAFKFLYKRPLFTALIDATADKLFKEVSRQAKATCKIESTAWMCPISTTNSSSATRLATAAQRANGHVDRLAKLLQTLDWAGSTAHRLRALERCRQVHQMLADVGRVEMVDWVDRLRQDILFNVNVARAKFAICRHFHRADWIQSNLDGVVLQVIQSAECWDRLLFDMPQTFQTVWSERNEIRIVYGTVTTMCHYHNHFIDGLSCDQKQQLATTLVKLDGAVETGLSRVTWTQLSQVKKFVSSVYLVLDELAQLMSPPPTPPPDASGDPTKAANPSGDLAPQRRFNWNIRTRLGRL